MLHICKQLCFDSLYLLKAGAQNDENPQSKAKLQFCGSHFAVSEYLPYSYNGGLWKKITGLGPVCIEQRGLKYFW